MFGAGRGRTYRSREGDAKVVGLDLGHDGELFVVEGGLASCRHKLQGAQNNGP